MSLQLNQARLWARYWGAIFYFCFGCAVVGTIGGILYDGDDFARTVIFAIAGCGLVFSIPSSDEHDKWKEIVKEYESK